MKKNSLPLHFDTFGTVPHVLNAIDQHVPIIFKGEDLSFLPSLKKTIRLHAAEHKWDIIVLNLSKGMAREEIDIILNHAVHHDGPVVVDPTAHTPEHETFYKEGLMLARKDRMITLNEQTGDIMVVMYGLLSIDKPRQMNLLMKRFHYAGVTLDMLIERDEAVDSGPSEEGIAGQLRSALFYIRNIYAKEADYEHGAKVEPIAQSSFIALASILTAYHMSHDPNLKMALNGLAHQITVVPDLFRDLEFSFEPFRDAAQALRNNPANPATQMEIKPEPAPPPPETRTDARPELKQTQQHDLKHDQHHHGYEHLAPKMEPN